MALDLTLPVYRQRIGQAVKSERAGRPVSIHVDGAADAAYLVWWDQYRHIIASGSKRGMTELLPLAQAEFLQQLKAEQDRKERGEPAA